jgi:hypothetical protein
MRINAKGDDEMHGGKPVGMIPVTDRHHWVDGRPVADVPWSRTGVVPIDGSTEPRIQARRAASWCEDGGDQQFGIGKVGRPAPNRF